ncbi:neutral zinc metallopeptidase [Saccharopolyspora taberi]|uniref:Metalloprotease n=1 Tax=Saccharopolyspora taberi TaxID=60895 RepID=A0ABN3VJF7_9PSEU
MAPPPANRPLPPPQATMPLTRPHPAPPGPPQPPTMPVGVPRFGPPPRKSNTGAIVAVVLASVFLLAVGSVGVLAVSSSSSSDASDYDDTSTSSETSSSETSSSDTSTSDSSSETTEPSSDSDAGPQPVPALGDNPFNIEGNGAMNTPCDLPAFSTDVSSQDAFYQAALPCLMAAWTPALEAANLPVRTPTVVTTGEDVNSPCGTRSWNQTAMYCPGNHTIYMTARYYAEKEQQTEAGVYLGQFAHEFGHAIQGMTGINSAYGDASYDAGGYETSAGLELTRRSELQATCFEGMALAALQNGGVSNDYIFPALQDSSNRGDEFNNQPDHGSTATNKVWVEQGFYKNRITECNTWLSPPEDVD